jgi:hypothetical protein
MYTLLSHSINWLNDWIFAMYDKMGLDWQHSPLQFDQINLLIVFILLNAVSITLFKFIEEPLNHYIRKSDFLIKSKARPVEMNINK